MSEICLKKYGRVIGREEEHMLRRMPGAEKPEKIRERPNLWWKYSCRRDMTIAGLREDDVTNRTECRKKVIICTGDCR